MQDAREPIVKNSVIPFPAIHVARRDPRPPSALLVTVTFLVWVGVIAVVGVVLWSLCRL